VLRERLLIAINIDCESINADEPVSLDPNIIAANDKADKCSSFDQDEEWQEIENDEYD